MSKWIILLLFSASVFGAPPSWQIVPEKSQLSFVATQNDAPIEGKFTQFSGTILFAPEQLDQSKITITIDMSSVDTEYQDVENTLRTALWFNVEQFPKATFESSTIKKLDNSNYSADGTLTIRDKALPVTLTFKLNQYDLATAIAEGKASLKRLDFGVGQGEWSSTSEVKNEVEVHFTINAIPIMSKNQ